MCFDDQILFGVPDEITDMKRSLEMFETSRIIYWTMLFRHRKSFERYRVKNGVPEGLPEPPGGTNGPPWALLEREEGRQGRPHP